jgi:hypothetical protein
MLENVVPHLSGGSCRKPRGQIADEILTFVGKDPELWGWYSAYDHVALAQLYGPMVDLPAGWPYYTRDVRQLASSLGWPERKRPPVPKVDEHDALADARWTKAVHAWCETLRRYAAMAESLGVIYRTGDELE